MKCYEPIQPQQKPNIFPSIPEIPHKILVTYMGFNKPTEVPQRGVIFSIFTFYFHNIFHNKAIKRSDLFAPSIKLRTPLKADVCKGSLPNFTSNIKRI